MMSWSAGQDCVNASSWYIWYMYLHKDVRWFCGEKHYTIIDNKNRLVTISLLTGISKSLKYLPATRMCCSRGLANKKLIDNKITVNQSQTHTSIHNRSSRLCRPWGNEFSVVPNDHLSSSDAPIKRCSSARPFSRAPASISSKDSRWELPLLYPAQTSCVLQEHSSWYGAQFYHSQGSPTHCQWELADELLRSWCGSLEAAFAYQQLSPSKRLSSTLPTSTNPWSIPTSDWNLIEENVYWIVECIYLAE